MAVTHTDISDLLNAESIVGGIYRFFQHYDISEDRVTFIIGLTTRYETELITESVRTDKADLFDDLCMYAAAFRIIYMNIMGEIMATGFSWSSLQLSVNTGNYPQIVGEMRDMCLAEVERLHGILMPRIEIEDQCYYGPDSHGVIADNFDDTAGWGY